MALIDLDDFKSVNDVYGRTAGDLLLVGTAARLSTAVRRGDTPARFGGDEFAARGRTLSVSLACRPC